MAVNMSTYEDNILLMTFRPLIKIAFLFVPVEKKAAQKVIDETYADLTFFDFIRVNLPIWPYGLRAKPQLLDVPPEYNFPNGTHPFTIVCGSSSDTRQGLLKIDGDYRGCGVFVPFTGTGKSSTAFNTPIISYLAGANPENDRYLAVLIPVIVAQFFGLRIRIGNFIPRYEAWQYDKTGADGEQLYSSSCSWAFVPNPLSGPGIYPPAVDMRFGRNTTEVFSRELIKKIINQPYILSTPINYKSIEKCEKNTYFVEDLPNSIEYRSGNVTFGPAAEGPDFFPSTLQKASPDGGKGEYVGVRGFSTCASQVGYKPFSPVGEDCEAAASSVDQNAL
jgi:hypothetical protein